MIASQQSPSIAPGAHAAAADVAIIGAGGFVGSRLTESLVLDGRAKVRAIVRSYRNTAGLCRFGSAVDVRRGDAEDVPALSEALAGVRTVVNVTTGAPAGIVRSTSAIYDACQRAGVSRFIHLSSAVVYGDVLTPMGDDAPPLGTHWMPYARAKGASEVWLRERLQADLLDVVVLRPGIVWGVRSPHTMEFAKALCGKSTYLVDGGRGIFNGIYIDNLVASILAACRHDGRAAGFYNVGDRETVNWREFYAALGDPLGCDCARLPEVSGEHFPRSLRSTIETIQTLPLVNELYHRVKTRVPDAVKAGIKARLEGPYRYDRVAGTYPESASVDRELWHLQRVGHKLPIEKFGRTFGFAPPVSFQEGIRKTIAWLQTLGLVSSHPSS
jgi:nucleoside-diphosphate-sugar epimerase